MTSAVDRLLISKLDLTTGTATRQSRPRPLLHSWVRHVLGTLHTRGPPPRSLHPAQHPVKAAACWPSPDRTRTQTEGPTPCWALSDLPSPALGHLLGHQEAQSNPSFLYLNGSQVRPQVRRT